VCLKICFVDCVCFQELWNICILGLGFHMGLFWVVHEKNDDILGVFLEPLHIEFSF
jgi:hypothetical protein